MWRRAERGLRRVGICVVPDLPDDRATAELDHCLRVDGFAGGYVPVLASSDNIVAGKQRTRFRFGREGSAGQGWIAGAKDYIVTDCVRRKV